MESSRGNNSEYPYLRIQMACFMNNLVIVSLYDSLGPSSVEFILRHAEAKIVLCNENVLEKVREYSVLY